MADDLIARAEALSATQVPQADPWAVLTVPYPLWAALIAALKAAQQTIETQTVLNARLSAWNGSSNG